jgi:modulator of FtsH protease HflC
MKMNVNKFFLAVIAIVIFLVLYSSLFTVTEGTQALVLRLGEISKLANGQPDVLKPGLHFKVPFISTDLEFDTRIQTLDINSSRIMTAEKKEVLVDYYVKWHIADLAQYYKSTSDDVSRAQVLLQQQVNNGLRAQFGQKTISEVVSDDRSAIMETLRKQANASAQPLGIDVVDVRIKAIDLPTEVSTSVFDRMRAERQRVAAEHRANGRSLAEAIRAKADATVTITLATANEQASQLRAQGDSQAAQIYTQAYNSDPNFYAFYRSLLAYRNTFNSKQGILVLSPQTQFFNNFVGSANSANKK